jgi:hypothetical protein
MTTTTQFTVMMTLSTVMRLRTMTVYCQSQQGLQTGKAFGISGPANVDDNYNATRWQEHAGHAKHNNNARNILPCIASGIVIGQMPARQGGATPLQQKQWHHCNEVKDASAMLAATRMQQGQQCQHNQQQHQHNAVNDESSNFATTTLPWRATLPRTAHWPSPWKMTLPKVGNFAKEGNFDTTKDGIFADEGNFCQGWQLHQEGWLCQGRQLSCGQW